MEVKKSSRSENLFRRSSLIAGKTGRMAFAYMGSSLCAATITLVDSLFAGINIGPKALAAIAAVGPLLTLAQILHCLLGFGIDKMMVRAIGKGNRREADRIFGSVLLTVVFVYSAVYLTILLLERPVLGILVKDTVMRDMLLRYSVPMLAATPLFEALLCIERAFRIDGRAGLFSLRGIVSNLANILFDALLVSTAGMGIAGLAWASVISTAIGYMIPLSHFFSKKRTVRPDFSVILSRKELFSHVKEDIRLGTSATLDEILGSVSLFAQTTVIGLAGGDGGLAIWAVYKTIRGIILALSNGASASTSIYAGLLYGQKDYKGVRYAVKTGTFFGLNAAAAVSVIVLALAGPVAGLFGLEPGMRPLCALCLRTGCAAFPAIAFLNIISAYLPAVNRVRLANLTVGLQNALVILSAVIGYVMSLPGIFLGGSIALWAGMLLLLVLLKRDRFWFTPERNPEKISDYSLLLEPARISAMSMSAAAKLEEGGYPSAFCSRTALVIEDSLNYTAQQNPGSPVRADIQMNRYQQGVQIIIIDNGAAGNPITRIVETNPENPGALEAVVVMGLSADVYYDRSLDLNHLVLHVKQRAGSGRDA